MERLLLCSPLGYLFCGFSRTTNKRTFFLLLKVFSEGHLFCFLGLLELLPHFYLLYMLYNSVSSHPPSQSSNSSDILEHFHTSSETEKEYSFFYRFLFYHFMKICSFITTFFFIKSLVYNVLSNYLQ